MSIGWSSRGQSFIEHMLPKIEAVRKRIDATGRDMWLEVDGGVKTDNARRIGSAGANTLVASSAASRAAAAASRSQPFAKRHSKVNGGLATCGASALNDRLQIAAIAFDLDGTLVDSAPDIGQALNSALARAGLRRFDLGAIRAWVGDGPDALIDRALAKQGVDQADGSLHSRIRNDFDAATLAAPLDLGRVYPGIWEMLKALHDRVPMAVVTNKPTDLARAVLEAAGLLEFMQTVSGADRPELRKPRPAMLLAAGEWLGVDLSRLLMVGDGPADIRSAEAAGCPAALVAWGYASDAVPASARLLHVATPGELLASLR